jgi:hypothetical protein
MCEKNEIAGKKLIVGKRYLFHEKTDKNQKIKMFRANFREIRNDRLIIDYCENDYCYKKTTMAIWSIPLELIVSIYTLDDILQDVPCVLPRDVLLKIDDYF